jgi:hypothetical protein
MGVETGASYRARSRLVRSAELATNLPGAKEATRYGEQRPA